MDLKEKMIESAQEIFSTMVMMEIAVEGQCSTETPPLVDSISGVVGLAGKYKGVLAIHLPNSVAMAITSSFLGMDVEEINEDVEDAVGELANMLAGDIKTVLSDKGRDIDLSIPTIISGHEYTFQSTKEVDSFIIPFSGSCGKFRIELQLNR